MKPAFYLIAALHCFLFAASVARAQAPAANPAPSSTIASIKVTGGKSFPADQVIAASGLMTGDVVTKEQIQGATDRLAALGIFSAVNYRYAAKGSAIELEFQVQESPLYPIVFDNFPWFTTMEIGDAIRSQVGLFTGAAPESGTMDDEITVVIENLLASKQVKASVTHQLLAAPSGDGMVLQFHADVPTLRIQSIQFGDPMATDSERLRDRVPDIKGQPYSLFAVELFENEQVRPLYNSKGFLKAKIGPPEAQLVPDMNDPKLTAVAITIPIQPGQVYSWKGISWQGNSALPSLGLDGLVDLKPGDPADGMRIEALWQKVEIEYGRRGYLDMKLTTEPQFDEAAHQISYHAGISEGPQYRMGQLVITGLSVDAEKRLRQHWRIASGQVFENDYCQTQLNLLAKPSRDVFGELPVHYNEFGHLLRPDPSSHTVDVLLDFK